MRQVIQKAVAFCLALSTAGVAARAGSLDNGIAAYKARDFVRARPLLAAYVKQNPGDANAAYYLGLTLHQLRDFEGAKQQYTRIVKSFPSSPAATLARQALALFTSGGAKRSTGGAGRPSSDMSGDEDEDSSASGELVSPPAESRVFFKRDGDSLVVDATVNNRAIAMIFDTGAETCTFGKNHLQELGMKLPTGSPTSYGVGVGDQGAVPSWTVRADIKVGGIMRRNMEIDVQERLSGEPLLGQTFFKDFTYTIDAGGQSILFQRKPQPVAFKGAGTAQKDPYAVPFRKEGDSLIVSAEINGKPFQMNFDTGADGIAFSYSHLQQLGIDIPQDAEQEVHRGIAGSTTGYGFTIKRLRLGPIDRSDVKVSVIGGMQLSHPLLGQSFLGSWQYTIDNSAALIRFLRR